MLAMPRAVFIIIAIIMLGCLTSAAPAQTTAVRMYRASQGHVSPLRVAQARTLGRLVYIDLTVQFRGTTAREAIGLIARQAGVTIIPRFADHRSDGIDPDEPITLDVTNEPALTVLERVLEQCGGGFDDCTWQFRGRDIEVSTKERLATRSQELHTYVVLDLLLVHPDFSNAPALDMDAALAQNEGGGGGRSTNAIIDTPEALEHPSERDLADDLMNLLRDLVEPDVWHVNGGAASVRYHNGAVIVRGPDFLHRQLRGLLRPIPPTRGAARRTVMLQGGQTLVFP